MTTEANEKSVYYNGSFAEIVSDPSELTLSYLKKWFTGANSLGSAMELLDLPYEKVSEPLLEKYWGELVVNLKVEEKTLYKNTLFSYKPQLDISQTPKLKLNWFKLLNPLTWAGTIKIIIAQSKWIAKPVETVERAGQWVNRIPGSDNKIVSTEELDQTLAKEVWPKVIAVGLLAEFFEQYLKTQLKEKWTELSSDIAKKISKQDWFFLSLEDQKKVKEKAMTFEEYLSIYGMRSDKDYELTEPRWIEIKEIIKTRIDNYDHPGLIDELIRPDDPEISPKIKTAIDCYIKLQTLRSEAKRKTLPLIYLLRQSLKSKMNEPIAVPKPAAESIESSPPKSFGKGTPICAGEIKGVCKQIKSLSDTLGDAVIGIFPNASPEFALLYPKCKGMIFFKGGQTSHGAIVAREFQIPSLIDPLAVSIPDGAAVSINGANGDWKIE